MSSRIQWANAELTWSPEGYHVMLDVWLSGHASALFIDRVPNVLSRFRDFAGADATITFEPGHIHRDERGSSAEPGRLRITAPRTLFAVDAEEFRAALSELAEACFVEGDEQHGRDEVLAAQWLAALRRPGAGSY